MSKEEELKFAKFFVDWLNKKYNWDYEAFPNINEGKVDTEVDVYGKSKVILTSLNFQIVTSESELRQMEANLRKISKITKQAVGMDIAMDLDSEQWIKKAIYEKEKKYSEEVKRSLVLLVQKYIGPQFDEEYFNNIFSCFNNSTFRGIYLVHYPTFSGYSTYAHNGQVLAIKKLKI